MTALDIVVMAAGKGTRMKSRIPKVLQRLAGRALLHVLGQAARLAPRRVVVVTGHGAPEVEAACARSMGVDGYFDHQFELQCVRQEPQLGTGHAVQQAAPLLADDGLVLVLSGDVPLTQADTLRALVAAAQGERLALLTVTLPDPTGYGRIVRAADGSVQRIVEHKDASAAERALGEVYSGIMAVPARLLKGWLARLTNDNAQREYYLTDVVAMAVQDGVPVVAHCITDALQVAGVNSPCAARGARARAPGAPGASIDGARRAPGRSRRASTCATTRTAAHLPSCAARRTWRSTWAASSRVALSSARACRSARTATSATHASPRAR
jgi:N-acetylglucosamine-1-phosphate uridyltransferase (contains nucleotidyltransferase and I-patch acetyltransferase domains)